MEHLSSNVHVVHTTAKQLISCRGKNEKVCEMFKNEKCTCTTCKTVGFLYQLCKFVTFMLPSSEDEWIVHGNIYSFVRRNSSGTSY